MRRAQEEEFKFKKSRLLLSLMVFNIQNEQQIAVCSSDRGSTFFQVLSSGGSTRNQGDVKRNYVSAK